MTERLRATGVRLFLVGELSFFAEGRPAPSTPEERANRDSEERGEVVFIALGAFCDLDDDGREFRFWGDFVAERAIRTDRDPTSELLAVVKEWAEDRLYNIEYDLMYGNDGAITRWEFFSAPFAIELSEGLRTRLANSWKDREPARLPGEREPYPPDANFGWF
jgi:hypothetical protein